MVEKPVEKSLQHHSFDGLHKAQILPPVAHPVPQIISPLVVESFHPKLRFRLGFALISAVLIDCIQLGFFPLFAPGFFSIADDLLDSVAFLWFWLLIGWHW